MALGDRIIVMDRGRIAQSGTPQEIYRAPANAFVADFIGTMNHLPAQAEAGLWRVPGGRVPMGPPSDAPATPAARLMFRPEDVALVHPDHAGSAGGVDSAHVEGTVVTALFLGNHTRLLVDVGAPHAADRRYLAPRRLAGWRARRPAHRHRPPDHPPDAA